jgi:hypothetical protein
VIDCGTETPFSARSKAWPTISTDIRSQASSMGRCRLQLSYPRLLDRNGRLSAKMACTKSILQRSEDRSGSGRATMQRNMFPHSNSHPQLKPIKTTASGGRACDHRSAFAQYPNPQISKPRAGLRLFSQGIRQHVLIQREVGHQPPQSAVLFFQLPQPPQARSPRCVYFFFQAEALPSNAELPTEVTKRGRCHVRP